MTNVNKWIVVGVAGVLVFGVLAAGGIAGVVYLVKREGRAVAEQGQQKQADTRTKVWEEAELKAVVMGKTTAEVKELLGVPRYSPKALEWEKHDIQYEYYSKVWDHRSEKAVSVSVLFRNDSCIGLKR